MQIKKLDEYTIGEAKELIPHCKALLSLFGESAAVSSSSELPYPVGTPVYVRTVTYHATGRIVGCTGQWMHLEQAAYIGSDGRFSEATAKGIQNVENVEIEMVGGPGKLAVSMHAIVDVTIHPEELPSKSS